MRALIATLFVAGTLLAAALPAQQLTLPALHWRTLETRYFEVHFPAAAAPWTLDMASRLDAEHEAVSALVGAAPHGRVTVVVQGDAPVSNGFALPFLDRPLVFLWPNPPGPASGVGDGPGWGELLSVHEYAHIAHLTRPSRNPWRRFIDRLAPIRLGPIALDAPRWVTEGYATYVEGRITGSGRPHSAWRAAVLRQWALEGRLPTYGQLDGDTRFLGGSMAYLVGSAYLEWLECRSGDSSLVHLWRRMSARRERTFADAFAGVFGGTAATLYGRFTAELTARALEVRQRLVDASAGAADSGQGTVVAALSWGTGSPALSPDGSLLAFTRAPRDGPERLVVLATAVDTAAERAAARARDSAQRRDPEDVPDVPWRPPPHRIVATLFPHGGVPYREPRFLPDGHRLLVVRATGRGDGSVRGDAFIWDMHGGGVRRVTHDAGLRHADPSPDGRSAVADRCRYGICDVVRVDLSSGRVTLLAAGAPRLVYDRPRWSPDGRVIAAAVQDDGVWRTVLLDARDSLPTPRPVGASDGANRYDAEFLAGDGALVLVSDASGIPNLVRLDIASGREQPLTSVSGAALAPAPDRVHGAVYFLRLHAGGLDIAVVPDSAHVHAASVPDPSLAPAVREPVVRVAAEMPSLPGASRPYGAGPRHMIVLPSLAVSAEGSAAGAMVSGTDPVGRLTWVAQGLYGERGTWRGGSIAAAWRGSVPQLGAEAFYASDRPSRQRGGVSTLAQDADYLGVVTSAEIAVPRLTNASRIRFDASAGRLHVPDRGSMQRVLGAASYALALAQTPGEWTLTEGVAVHGALGRTGGDSWARGVARVRMRVSAGTIGVVGEAALGAVSGAAPAFERFTAGGSPPPLFDPDLLSQRFAMPAVPAGILEGRHLANWRVSLPEWSFEPYLWGASDLAGQRTGVVGLEWHGGTSGFAPGGLPAIDISGGAGYAFAGAFRYHTRVYLMVRYRP